MRLTKEFELWGTNVLLFTYIECNVIKSVAMGLNGFIRKNLLHCTGNSSTIITIENANMEISSQEKIKFYWNSIQKGPLINSIDCHINRLLFITKIQLNIWKDGIIIEMDYWIILQ